MNQLIVENEKELSIYLDSFISRINFNDQIKKINIELGNSLSIFHLGVIRQIKFGNYIKDYLHKIAPKDVEIKLIFYESDGLAPLVKNSRGINIINDEIGKFFPFNVKKKLPVIFQSQPENEDILKFLTSIKSYLLNSETTKKNYSKREINNRLEKIKKFLKNGEDQSLSNWYRSININILKKLNINQPNWIRNSDFIYQNCTKNELINICELIIKKTNTLPIWILDKSLKNKSRMKDINEIFYLFDNSNYFLYPDVILRQTITSTKYPVIRLHGNIYPYQKKVERITKSLYPSIRLIYNAKVDLQSKDIREESLNSIDWVNVMLGDKVDYVDSKIREKSHFLPILL